MFTEKEKLILMDLIQTELSEIDLSITNDNLDNAYVVNMKVRKIELKLILKKLEAL